MRENDPEMLRQLRTFHLPGQKFCSEVRISAKLFKFDFNPVLVSWTYTIYESSQAFSDQHKPFYGLAHVAKKVHLSVTDKGLVRNCRRFF